MSHFLKNRNIVKAVRIRWKRWLVNLSLWRLTRLVNRYAPRPGSRSFNQEHKDNHSPVVIFNASTRLIGVSQNAAFALLTAAGLQMAGIPVIYFGCHSGMRKCVLGTRLDDLAAGPPCKPCIAQASWLFANAPVVRFQYQENPPLEVILSKLDLPSLCVFEYQDLPLGSIVLPSMRWVLRRHHIQDDEATRQLFCDYILSAFHVAQEFSKLIDQVIPRAVVVFNGMFFPEATARFVAQKHGIPVVSHEVGLRPFTAFFTFGQATAYPLDIPVDFQMNEIQNSRLDRYLEQRFKGDFSMAGIKFWKGMQSLSKEIEAKISSYRQIVPVFTNVIFDTSQPHSNIVFEHMFAWLDLVLELARLHPDTLFVIRAHPDEGRMWKKSRQSVTQWVEHEKIQAIPNIFFIPPDQALSSYELISCSKFIMIYNSTIGLEASILGVPVLCAGRARFTRLPTVFFPQTIDEYRQKANEFLQAETIDVPPEYQRNARRFLYYQLYRSSLPFGDFLEQDGIWPGFVKIKRFSWQHLTPVRSPGIKTILDGILNGQDFILPDESVRE